MQRLKRWPAPIVIPLLLLGAVGCSKPTAPGLANATPQPTATLSTPSGATTGFDACALLTKEETQAVQGEPFKQAKPSQKSGAGLEVSQCYFELPTPVNSIVLTVTHKIDGGRDPGQSWKDIFHREKTSGKKEETEEKEPQQIEGVGDEAFWTGTKIGGALYVLKGNCYIRISVGGADDQAHKIEKSKALAASVLKRL